MHSKSGNIEIMTNDKADEVAEEIFESIFYRYQIRLETSLTDSDFIFDCAHLLYYKYHKINLDRGVSYIVSPEWIKNKQATINAINKNEKKCFNTV